MIYFLTAVGLTLGGSSTVHIYIQTVRRTTQLTNLAGRLSGRGGKGGIDPLIHNHGKKEVNR
jgi:hypothetical protein